ncbi:MAG: hypothetical protein AAF108_10435 [Planctomycetota bacterium]
MVVAENESDALTAAEAGLQFQVADPSVRIEIEQVLIFSTGEPSTDLVIACLEHAQRSSGQATFSSVEAFFNLSEADREAILDTIVATDGSSHIINLKGDPDEKSPPKGKDGKDLPPPVKLPDGKNGLENEWEKVKHPDGYTGRQRWKPKHTIPSPKGSQPQGTWDDGTRENKIFNLTGMSRAAKRKRYG